MTVVDLPGMIAHHEVAECKQIIDDMTQKYIENENCIILAVSPAGDDIENSMAIAAAKKVDPERKRTIGASQLAWRQTAVTLPVLRDRCTLTCW